jgi:hypothetical protein
VSIPKLCPRLVEEISWLPLEIYEILIIMKKMEKVPPVQISRPEGDRASTEKI